MEKKLEQVINKMYKAIIYDKRTKRHRFLSDIETAEEIHAKRVEYNNHIYNISNGIYNDLLRNGQIKKSIKNLSVCNNYYDKKNVLTASEIMSTNERVKDAKTENEMFDILNEISGHKLIGTINSISDVEERFKEKQVNELNVLIVGAGPNGLFLANYINQLYNNSYSNIRVNLLVLDNRVYSETIRYPYIRNRFFSISTRYLDILLPGIYCKKNKKDVGMMIPIKYLELLLYMKTFEERIPLYFTKKYERWNDIKRLIEELKIDVMYDSTGGRIDGINLKNDPRMLMDIDMESDRYSFKIDRRKSRVDFDLRGHMDRFLSIEVFGEKMFYFEPITFDIHNEEDYKLFNGLCVKKENMIEVIKRVKDDRLRRKIAGLYMKEIRKNEKIDFIQFNSFKMNMYHRLKVSEIMRSGKQQFLYIGTGDTIFSSHYAVGAGLNRTLVFSIKTSHLFPMLFA